MKHLLLVTLPWRPNLVFSWNIHVIGVLSPGRRQALIGWFVTSGWAAYPSRGTGGSCAILPIIRVEKKDRYCHCTIKCDEMFYKWNFRAPRACETREHRRVCFCGEELCLQEVNQQERRTSLTRYIFYYLYFLHIFSASGHSFSVKWLIMCGCFIFLL